MPFQSTKTYGHELGLSCAFRQWRADSHCKYIHGYALRVKLTFEAETLDHRNWVMDFGGLRDVKAFLQENFDHKTVVAADDPNLDLFESMQDSGLVKLTVLKNVGCEAFAEHIFDWLANWLRTLPENSPRKGAGGTGTSGRVKLLAVEVAEHGGNSALKTR